MKNVNFKDGLIQLGIIKLDLNKIGPFGWFIFGFVLICMILPMNELAPNFVTPLWCYLVYFFVVIMWVYLKTPQNPVNNHPHQKKDWEDNE